MLYSSNFHQLVLILLVAAELHNFFSIIWYFTVINSFSFFPMYLYQYGHMYFCLIHGL